MKSIRKNVFETNSSSTHSLTVKRNKTGKYDYNFPMNKSGFIPLVFGAGYDFGWGPAQYNDAYAKLNYLVCMSFQIYQMQALNHNRRCIIKPMDILKIKDVKKIEKVISQKIPTFRGFYIGIKDEFFLSEDYDKPGEYILCMYEGIDHQSCEDYEFENLDAYLKMNKISIENFIFNPRVVLNISNDNG